MWYKTAIIYSLNVKEYYDSNDDGTGDIRGLIGKLDYIKSLGFNCIWIRPFFPSPHKDDGYDVEDYYNVDPMLGNLGDFVQLIHEAEHRGIKIIIDLVVNHTSTEHPWFKDSSSDRNSKYRDYYIWQDNPKRKNEEKNMLDGSGKIWEYSEKTNSYYLHRYYRHQADLNLANPEVVNEIRKIMEFWLKIGVSGFRIDAAHAITDPVDVDHINFGNLHSLFEKMNQVIREYNPSAVLLGEASVSPDELRQYFLSKDGKIRLHMLYNFLSNKHTFLAFARKRGDTLNEALGLYKDIEPSHWLNFVRHHDELNLELLNESEKKEVWRAFAPDEDMRIFGHGIRRRLPPMLDNDMRRLKLFYAIIFGLPGIPLINYGEEIGMGDDLSLEGRNSVRTPMQWSTDKNAGFSRAPKDKLYRPVIDHGEYSYKKINVQDQQYHHDSFLNYICRLIRIRHQNPGIGKGTIQTVKTNNKRVAAWCFDFEDTLLLVVYNLSEENVKAKIRFNEDYVKMVPVLDDGTYDKNINLSKLSVHPYGFRWIQLLKS